MKNSQKLSDKKRIVNVAMGVEKADLVLKNSTYLNVFSKELSQGDIAICNGVIAGIGCYHGREETDMTGKIVLPGFIDSHIHLESSLCVPGQTALALIRHGTTTLVTDPHEIANVMGTDGIEYMLSATKGLPVDVHFMLPSCVPADSQEESGAKLTSVELERFYSDKRVSGLAEFMDNESVINGDDDALKKICDADCFDKPTDGHAPMLSGKKLNAYIASGVMSDHECYDIDDAINKLRNGQYIMIREGTAATNLTALMPLLTPKYESRCTFCVDDRHPDDLIKKGDIDYICKKAIKLGADPLIVCKVATFNSARYFNLNHLGAIAPGYIADIAVINNFDDFNVEMVYKKGKLVYNGKVLPFDKPVIDQRLIDKARNTFNVSEVTEKDFSDRKLKVMGMVDGEILTTDEGYAEKPDTDKDILKIAVVERHKNTHHIGNGYLKGYGLKKGAVATSIAHDSHNIIVVGTNARDMAFAVNRIIKNHGGIVVVCNEKVLKETVLEIGGIMTDTDIYTLSENLEETKNCAYKNGASRNNDPFMTLSFMSLPVIPELRITTKGVYDVLKRKVIE